MTLSTQEKFPDFLVLLACLIPNTNSTKDKYGGFGERVGGGYSLLLDWVSGGAARQNLLIICCVFAPLVHLRRKAPN